MASTCFHDTAQRSNGARIPVIAHPSSTAAIIINYPGYGGTIDGYNNKYRTLCSHLAAQKIGACVQMQNTVWQDEAYEISAVADLWTVRDYAMKNALVLTGVPHPALYLMGFSAGAGAIAACAHVLGASKILLINPADNVGEAIRCGLPRYIGEVWIAVGDKDEVIGDETGVRYFDLAQNATRKVLQVIPDCDHQLTGKRCGKILSKAPLWAFAGDTSFPSPEGGIELY